MASPLAFAAGDEAEAVAGNNAFAVGLYDRLRRQPGNLFFSPESISTVLAMTYAGARGDTATEMAAVMHFTLAPDKLGAAIGALLRERNGKHEIYQLKEADALWGQQDYGFRDEFLASLKNDYGADFDRLDFKGATEAARQTINRWIEQRTENKIKDLIGPGVLKSDTRLVLTNAIYFMASWQTPFRKASTYNQDFHVSAERTVSVPLMHIAGDFNYFEGGSFQALELPYARNELSMVVLLPKAANGLPDFEQTLTPANMAYWLGQLRPYSEIIVTVPKFKAAAKFELNDALQAMGMKRAFNQDTADLSGMTGKRDLYIAAAIHQAFVDVDEAGTEAAAATAVVVAPTTAMAPVAAPPPIVFRADHPFMFLIRDNRSGAILFMGRVVDPSP